MKHRLLLDIAALVAALVASTVALAQEPIDCHPKLESPAQAGAWRIRATGNCRVSEGEVIALIDSALAQRPNRDTFSIFLGRFVNYPWLMHGLATDASVSPDWDAKRGRARNQYDNAVVARLLMQGGGLAQVRAALEGKGYRLSGVSVEKVLVGTHREFPDYVPAGLKGKLPFDAMVWLRVTPTDAPRP